MQTIAFSPQVLAELKPLERGVPRDLQGTKDAASQLAEARTLRQTFGQFFGETFYGQMIKSMRTAVDKPAYFHGGRAEEIFQGQLDQTLAEEMTTASADQLIGPMFEQAFPRAAEVLAQHERSAENQPTLTDLDSLRRR